MKENNYILFLSVRLLISLLPLAFGWPLIAFCFCVYNLVVITLNRGLAFGGAVALGAAAAGGLLAAAMNGAAFGCAFALKIVLGALAAALAFAFRRSFAEGLLYTSAAYGIGEAISLKAAASEAGQSIADYVFSGIEPAFTMAADSLAKSTDPAAQIYMAYAQRLMDGIAEFFRLCVPSALIISSLIAGYVVMWLISRTLRGSVLDNGHRFSEIRLGIPSLIFGAVMLGLVFIPQSAVRTVGMNGFMVFLFLSFCAGMSLTDFLLGMKIKNESTRILVHGLLFLGGTFVMMLFPLANIFIIYIIMGVVDCFASFRKRVTTRP